MLLCWLCDLRQVVGKEWTWENSERGAVGSTPLFLPGCASSWKGNSGGRLWSKTGVLTRIIRLSVGPSRIPKFTPRRVQSVASRSLPCLSLQTVWWALEVVYHANCQGQSSALWRGMERVLSTPFHLAPAQYAGRRRWTQVQWVPRMIKSSIFLVLFGSSCPKGH